MPFETPLQTIDSEARLNRFNRLMQELIRGSMSRNTFQPWEIEILIDIEGCQIREPVKRETLRRYQKAVQRSMEKGAPMPLRLSEYLSGKKGAQSQSGSSTDADVSPEADTSAERLA